MIDWCRPERLNGLASGAGLGFQSFNHYSIGAHHLLRMLDGMKSKYPIEVASTSFAVELAASIPIMETWGIQRYEQDERRPHASSLARKA